MSNTLIREKIRALRKNGKSYSAIQEALGQEISKSTISSWCCDIQMTRRMEKKRRSDMLAHLVNARELARQSKKLKSADSLRLIRQNNHHLLGMLTQRDAALIALTVLYMCEGMKEPKRASLTFGNSDPSVIRFFLKLLRSCFALDENKFRCTIQCRADQESAGLEAFWSEITGIPKLLFYKTRIDERTRGKPSRKKDYKGVCRIDYFSSQIFKELLEISRILVSGS